MSDAVKEAGRESEDRYRILFESFRDAMMVLAPPTWPTHQQDGRPFAEKAREVTEIALRKGVGDGA